MNKKDIKKIHFVGIKGVGVAPLAIIAKEAGFEVSGSDVEESFITDQELKEAGIVPFVGFSKNNVVGVDLVIATGAHGGRDNIEVKTAIENNISILNQGTGLGIFQEGEIFGKKFSGISVAGSHGKTTTTAMIATILKENNLDPSYVIGTGKISSLGLSGHYGSGKYFVAEADEYVADVVYDKTPKFLFQNPLIIVITNIDYDHPDIFDSIDDIQKVFLEFANKLPEDGVLIACGDGNENRKFLSSYKGRRITYGFSPDNTYSIERVNSSPEKMFFWVKSGETILGQFSTGVFGEHNAVNALGAIVVGLEVGLSIDQTKQGISVFKGTKRRSELIGKMKNGAIIYDDYGHHPEEVRKTISAFKKNFPKHNLVVVFQPHMYSRTKKLFQDFTTSFSSADEVIISEIFPSFREEIDPNFSSSLLVDEVKKYVKKANYFSKLGDVVKYLSSQDYNEDTVIITMGAGDVYKVGRELLNNG